MPDRHDDSRAAHAVHDHSRSHLLAAGAVLLLLALGFALFDAFGADGDDPRPRATPSATARGDGRTPADNRGDDRGDDRGDRATAPAIERSVAAPPTSESPTERLSLAPAQAPPAVLDVRVLDGPTGEPIEAAELFVSDAVQTARFLRQAGLPPSAEPATLAADCGTRFVTDDLGRARVTLDGLHGPLLAARAPGNRFGCHTPSPAELRAGKTELILRADETLELRAEDHTGAPLGNQRIEVHGRSGDQERPVWGGRTDAAGTLRIPHFQVQRERGRIESTDRFVALLAVPGPRPPTVEFRGEPVPAEPIVLRAPPLARVTLRVVDRTGVALRAPFSIGIVSPERTIWTPKPSGAEGVDLQADPALANLEAIVRSRAGNQLDFRGVLVATQPTPHAAAPTTFSLPLPDRLAILAGRLTSQTTGHALGGLRVEYELRDGARSIGRGHVRTFDDGGLEIPCPVDAADPLQRPQLSVRLRQDERVFGSIRTLVAPLPAGGRLQLGDLGLRVLPPLASGRVVDDRGEPVSGASVTVQASRLLRTTTDEGGAFALHGDPQDSGTAGGEPLTLEVRRRGHRAQTRIVAVGSSGLRILLARQGDFRCAFRVPEGTPGRALIAELVPSPGSPSPAPRPAETSVSCRGTEAVARFDTLDAGTYDLRVRIRGFATPVAEVPAVRIRSGTGNRDDRVDALDLRVRLFRYDVDISGAEPSARADMGGALLIEPSPSDAAQSEWVAFTLADLRASFVLPRPFAQAVLVLPGRPRTRQRLDAGSTTWHLPSPAAEVTLQLTGLPESLSRGFRIDVGLSPVGEPSPSPRPQIARALDHRSGHDRALRPATLAAETWATREAGRDTVTLRSAHTGPCEVTLRIRQRPSAQATQRIRLGTIELSGAGTSRHVLAVPSDRLRAALQVSPAESADRHPRAPGRRR